MFSIVLSDKTITIENDLALIVTANGEYSLITHVNRSMDRVVEWITRNDLRTALSKTEAIILKGRRNRDHIVFTVGTPNDNRVSSKAEERMVSLARIMSC